MGQFFRQRHPWIMQAVGGLIAVVVFAPFAIFAWINLIANAKPQQAATTYAPPGTAIAGNPQGAQTEQPNTGTSGNAPNGGKIYTVKMEPGHAAAGFVFSPSSLTIHAGDTVKWVDVNSTPHNIVGQGAAVSVIDRTAINIDPYSVTFTKAGTYRYLCQIHPGMVGVIKVVGGTVPSSSSSSGSGSSTQVSTASVTVKEQPGNAAAGFVFSPATVTVHPGTTVKWVDANSTPHNIVGQGAAVSVINRTAINTNPYAVKFTKAGTYHYLCQIHPGMVGTVIVR
jgi:plastocyanin